MIYPKKEHMISIYHMKQYYIGLLWIVSYVFFITTLAVPLKMLSSHSIIGQAVNVLSFLEQKVMPQIPNPIGPMYIYLHERLIFNSVYGKFVGKYTIVPWIRHGNHGNSAGFQIEAGPPDMYAAWRIIPGLGYVVNTQEVKDY